MSNTEAPDFLTVAQTAEELKITGRAVRHRIAAGTLSATKLGPGTSGYIIARAEVDRIKADSVTSEAAAS